MHILDSMIPLNNNVDNQSSDTFVFDQVKEKSLKAAGYAYLVGDMSLFAAGVASKRYKEAVAGLMYTTGGVVLARYGNPKAEKRLQILYQDLGSYLASQGVTIPKGTQINTAMLAKDGGIIDHIERFLYQHPSQTLNAIYALGGVELLRSGLQHKKQWDTASGALVAAGGLAGLLIPEHILDDDDKDSKQKSQTMVGKAWSWIQEKPLRASGILYMGNNVTLTMSALKERRANPESNNYLFKLLTAASYVVANSLLTMSYKDNMGGKKDKKEDKESTLHALEYAAAEVIAAQPTEVQDALLHQVAGYLSGQGGVNIPADELAVAMREAINERTQRPAVDAAKPAADTPQNWEQRVENKDTPASPALA